VHDSTVNHNEFTKAAQHLSKFFGAEPELRPIPAPMELEDLTQLFSFGIARMFSKNWFLAILKSRQPQEQAGKDHSLDATGHEILTGSAGGYERVYQRIQVNVELPIAFVIPRLKPSTRDRMVQKSVPFIVPGTQVYLPEYVIDLRERFPEPPTVDRPFTPAAQLTLLYHLQRHSLNSISLQKIAKIFGYSAMMMTKIRREFEGSGIISLERKNREACFRFTDEPAVLWSKVKDRCESPLKKRVFVSGSSVERIGLISGGSALKHYGYSHPQPIEASAPVYAIGRKNWDRVLRNGEIKVAAKPQVAAACMEIWSYDPEPILAGRIVDPLSLALCLRGSSDAAMREISKSLSCRAHFQSENASLTNAEPFPSR
jgi:hypothetical protein